MFDTVVIFCAKYLVFIGTAAFLIFLSFTLRRTRTKFLLVSLIALPLAYLLGKAASYAWYEPRPFVESGIAPLIEHAADNGFPSDHMLLAATLASLVTLRSPKWGAFFWALALLVGTARVLAGLHHSVDIFASAIIAIVSAYIAFYAVVLRNMRRRSL